MQLKPKYQKQNFTSDFLRSFHGNYKKYSSHITMIFEILCFGILPDNRHTKYPQNYSIKNY
jgi:hypothetical protein